MSFFYQSGEGMNLLARAAAVKAPILTNGVIDPNFPIAGLYDGRPSLYAKYATLAAYLRVVFDLNLLQGGDGETPLDSSWVSYSDTGTPTISQYGIDYYSPSNSIRIQLTAAGGPHSAGIIRVVYFRAGEKLRFYHAGMVVTGTNVTMSIQNLETGNYLANDGTWSASPTVVTHSTGGWTDGQITFIVPDAETGGGLWQRLQVVIQGASSGTTIDVRVEAKIVPGWDTLALFGHTMTPFVSLGFEYQALSGNDPRDSFISGSSITDWFKTPQNNASPIPVMEWDQQAVWNKAQTTRYERWVAFYLTQGNFSVPSCAVGELLLVQVETLPTAYVDMLVTLAEEAAGQLREEGGAGDPWVYNRSAVPRRRLTLRYFTASDPNTNDDAAERAARRLLLERPMAGRWPCVVIPYDFDRRIVLYGTTRESLTTEFDKIASKRRFEVELVEYPIPGLHHTLGTI